MEAYLITFRSITPAQRGEALLRRGQISCTLRRTPGWLQDKGCGYSLRLSKERVLDAVSLLRSAKIPFQKVYYQPEKGNAEEVSL